MSDFAPSTDAARAALPGIPIVTRKHPGGASGARVSLHEVAKRIRDGRLDPRVRAWAIQTLNKAGRPKGHQARAQAILDELRRKAMYVPDPVNTEFMVAAHLTLCLDGEGGLCMAGEDCDGLVVAFGSATMSVGIPTHVVGQAFDGSRTPTHVIAAVQVESGDWLRADPSHDSLPVGRAIHATWEVSLDPLDDEDCGLAGKAAEEVAHAGSAAGAAGDYVGVGAIPAGSVAAMTRTWHRTPLGWRHVDRRGVGVGTLLGMHTVAELKDLLAAKDYQLAQLGQAFSKATGWATSDPTSYAAWQTDFSALMQRYNAARTQAQAIVDANSASIIPANMDVTGEGPYELVLAAIHHDPEQTGDLTDLDRRLTKGAGVTADYSQTPQPTSGSDVDLSVYQGAGKALDAVGLPKDAAAFPWAKAGLIAGGVLLGLVVVNKVIDKVL
jgi:hypothetical protein